MSSSSSMPCPSCGSELAVYPKNPATGHPCPLCGHVGFASLPAPIRQWLSTHMATVSDMDSARIAVEELIEYMIEQDYDEGTKFSARLAFEEAALATIRREHGG